MNQLNDDTIQARGKTYHYDPDRDIWYPIQADEHPISAWAWVVVVAILLVICYWAEYL